MTHVHALSVRRGLIFVSVAAIAWGTSGVAGAFLQDTGELSPVTVSFWRFALGGVLLFTARRLGGLPTDRPHWGTVAIVGPAMAVCQAAYFAAIAEAGVAVATLITMGTVPVLVALGGRLFLREPLSRAALQSVGLALVGLALLLGGRGELTPVGAGYAVLSAAAYSGVTLVARRPHDGRRSDDDATVWAFAVGALCLLPVAVSDNLLPQAGDLWATGALLVYLGAVPTALAYGLFFAGLRSVRGTTAAVIALLEPLVAAVVGVALLGEHLAGPQVVGGAVLMGAVLLLARAELAARSAGRS